MIGVIIPVYNAELYLEQCVDSVLKSSIHDIEVLLIDDGSTDSSPCLCDRFAESDSRVRVFHIKNGGPSAARNYGLEKCRGEYVMFVDSDDYVEPTLCERLLTSMTADGTDFAFCGHYNVSSKGIGEKLFAPSDCVFYGEDHRNMILLRTLGPLGERDYDPRKLDLLSPIWARLYKKRIIDEHGLRFVDLKKIPSECMQFNFEYCLHAEGTSYVASPLYYYRRNTVSSVTKHYRNDLLDKWVWWNGYMEEYLGNHGELPELRQAFHGRLCCALIPLSGNALRLDNARESMKEMRSYLRSDIFPAAFADFDPGQWAFYWRAYFFSAKHRLVASYYLMSWVMRKIVYAKHK